MKFLDKQRKGEDKKISKSVIGSSSNTPIIEVKSKL
jgi:hypothetical protein